MTAFDPKLPITISSWPEADLRKCSRLRFKLQMLNLTGDSKQVAAIHSTDIYSAGMT